MSTDEFFSRDRQYSSAAFPFATITVLAEHNDQPLIVKSTPKLFAIIISVSILLDIKHLCSTIEYNHSFPYREPVSRNHYHGIQLIQRLAFAE